jgi:hypothetical protein
VGNISALEKNGKGPLLMERFMLKKTFELATKEHKEHKENRFR